MPGKALRESQEQRFRRFLKNGSVRVRPWYRPVAPVAGRSSEDGRDTAGD